MAIVDERKATPSRKQQNGLFFASVFDISISLQAVYRNKRMSELKKIEPVPLMVSIGASPIPNSAVKPHQGIAESAVTAPQQDIFFEALKSIESRLPVDFKPKVGIICGSGLSGLAGALSGPITEMPYETIPHFAKSTVQGHAGKLVFGRLNNIPAVCMVGRLHFYEGWALTQTTFPVRIMSLLGVQLLIVTNAAGSLNHVDHRVGDIMVIKDHINWPGMAGHNPLIGPNLEQFGPVGYYI